MAESGGVESAQHLQEGCLAAPARSRDGHEIAFLDAQVDPTQGTDPAVLVGAGDRDDFGEAGFGELLHIVPVTRGLA